MTNCSHYFEKVEKYLRTTHGIMNCEAMRELIKKDGCPEELILEILNGALVDFIFDLLPSKNGSVKLYGPNGEVLDDNRNEYTYDEWVESLCKTFDGLSEDQMKAIINYMIKKGFIIVDTSGILFRGMAPLRRMPVKL